MLPGRLARLRVGGFPEERDRRQQTMHCLTGAAAANIVYESAEPTFAKLLASEAPVEQRGAAGREL